MKELIEYRTKLIARLVEAAREFRLACLAVQDVTIPLDAGGWTVHQIAAHTRDVDKLVYGARARRTAAEHNPEFQNFDGEAYMARHYASSEPLAIGGIGERTEDPKAGSYDLKLVLWTRVESACHG